MHWELRWISKLYQLNGIGIRRGTMVLAIGVWNAVVRWHLHCWYYLVTIPFCFQEWRKDKDLGARFMSL